MGSLFNTPESRARRKQLRKDSTEAEKKLWSLLRSRQLSGLKFYRQYNVGPYFLDFYCPVRRLAVEVDGGQHAFDGQVSHDAARTTWLRAYGIRVVRYWNNEVLDNPEGVFSDLQSKVNSTHPPLPQRGGVPVPSLSEREG